MTVLQIFTTIISNCKHKGRLLVCASKELKFEWIGESLQDRIQTAYILFIYK